MKTKNIRRSPTTFGSHNSGLGRLRGLLNFRKPLLLQTHHIFRFNSLRYYPVENRLGELEVDRKRAEAQVYLNILPPR